MNFPPELAIKASNLHTVLSHFTDDTFRTESEHLIFDESLISLQLGDIESHGIAGRIWEAAYAMSLYIQPPRTWEFEPPCSLSRDCGAIVELGSGSGYLGCRLAQILSLRTEHSQDEPKLLILTDLEDVCPLLRRNSQTTLKDLFRVNLVIQPLEWGNQEQGNALAADLTTAGRICPLLSHIICSDLVYFPELFAPLLRTLLQLSSYPFASNSQPVKVIISYMIRNLTKESMFWSAFGVWFDLAPVLVRQKSDSITPWQRFGGHNEGSMFIFLASRKPESFGWPIPDDADLIKGGDDTFETLLFMNIAVE